MVKKHFQIDSPEVTHQFARVVSATLTAARGNCLPLANSCWQLHELLGSNKSYTYLMGTIDIGKKKAMALLATGRYIEETGNPDPSVPVNDERVFSLLYHMEQIEHQVIIDLFREGSIKDFKGLQKAKKQIRKQMVA